MTPDIPLLPLALGCAALALATWIAIRPLLDLLVHLGLYDQPNARSSHQLPRPRGAGLALLPLILLAWTLAAPFLGPQPDGFWPVMGAALCLGVVCWLDDLQGLSPLARLGAQALAVAVGLVSFGGWGGEVAAVFQGWLPIWLALPLAFLAWLWFVNLYNFMDGIDGITGVESLSIGLGMALVGLVGGLLPPLVALPALVAAGAIGFLVWNWQPARIFLGDVGSVTLGYLLGWLLLKLAAEGLWVEALILPAYYLADATITLARRAARLEKVWEAHREHFYQRAVRAGASHASIASKVGGCNLILAAVALASAAGWFPAWLALLLAGTVVTLFLASLAWRARRAAG